MPNIIAPPIIAIDGTTASGKGTLARRLAAHLHYAYLDTGLLYRAVGVLVLRSGGDPLNTADAERAAQSLTPDIISTLSSDQELRSEAASQAASKVASIPVVRAALLQFQRDFCTHPPQNAKGAVLDGRDIGTVIAPDAPVKLFITASSEIRAQRRHNELQQKGSPDTYETVLADLIARDTRDAERAIAPTRPAPDAVVLDTSSLTADEVFQKALTIVVAVRG